MPDFSTLVPQARSFLAELAQNNSRDWFQAHKADYSSHCKDPAEALLTDIAPRLAETTGTTIATKLFRVNRDVRFSKDKTPYNTHLHMLWREADRTDGPAWFLGIGLDYLRAGWGWMGWSAAQISTWRSAIDGAYGAGIAAAIAQSGLKTGDPELKRVPAPHAKDHPLAEHLRRKSLALWCDPEDAQPAILMAQFKRAEPGNSSLA